MANNSYLVKRRVRRKYEINLKDSRATPIDKVVVVQDFAILTQYFDSSDVLLKTIGNAKRVRIKTTFRMF